MPSRKEKKPKKQKQNTKGERKAVVNMKTDINTDVTILRDVNWAK